MSERESLSFDVLIVGAGPAGLATAIRLAQLGAAAGRELEICVLEKGSEVGAHILSGAVVDPKALAELFPDWQALGAPLRGKRARECRVAGKRDRQTRKALERCHQGVHRGSAQ